MLVRNYLPLVNPYWIFTFTCFIWFVIVSGRTCHNYLILRSGVQLQLENSCSLPLHILRED